MIDELITTYWNIHNENSTGGVTHLNGKHFCHSHGDAYRGVGVKIPKVTLPPAVACNVGIRYSPGFKREMLVLYTRKVSTLQGKTLYYLEGEGISFTWIYNHGGAVAAHSSGCVLSGYNRVDKHRISDTSLNAAEKDLFEAVAPAIRAGKNVIWEFEHDIHDVYQLRWKP